MKQPSLLFRIHRFIYFILKGIGKREAEHYLFTLYEKLTDFDFYTQLAATGWTPNYMGYIYKGQIYQCRRIIHYGKHQFHVRCYDTGRITGHMEITPEWSESDHIKGVDLRTMNSHEAERLKQDITGVTRLRRKFPVRGLTKRHLD